MSKAIGGFPWRTGRKVGRTIYDAWDNLIGVMDTPELAAAVVKAVNFLTLPDMMHECPGYDRGSIGEPCCERAGEHDGSGGGEYPKDFRCPKDCGCHD